MKNLRIAKTIGLGVNALWRHKVKFVFVTFLFALTLAFFVFGLGVLRYDGAGDTLNYYRESGRKHASVKVHINDLIDEKDMEGSLQKMLQRRDALTTLFKKHTFFPLYPKVELIKFPKRQTVAVGTMVSGTVVVGDNDTLNKMGFKLNSGRLPKDKTEICISEFAFQLLCKVGRMVYDQHIVPTFAKSYDDIINHETSVGSGIKVVGVIDTFFDGSDLFPWIEKAGTVAPEDKDYFEYQNAIDAMKLEAESSISFATFVSPQYAEERFPFYTDVFCPLTGSRRADLSLFKAMTPLFEDGKVQDKVYSITNGYLVNMSANLARTEKLNDLGIKIMGIFCVFTVLMMFNFIGTTIKTQQRKIGIYRALGMRRKTIFGIFLVESLLSAAIAFVAASAMSLGIAVGYRALLVIPNPIYPNLGWLLFPQWYTFLAGGALAILIAIVGTFIPFVPLLKKKPSEIIRKPQ